MGILLFACLTGGSTPWKLADVLKDSAFNHYCDWSKRRCNKTPLAFQPFSSRLTRLLKRLLEPKPTQRCKIQEVNKYLKDDWINVTSKSSFSLIFGSDSKTNVSRSNSDMDQPPKRGTSCRKSMLRGKSRKVKTTNGSETEPVFRICCKFQTKNEQGRKPSFSS